MKIKVVLFVFASIAICKTNVSAQEGTPHPAPKQSQHLTLKEKFNVTASICRPTMQEIEQINPAHPISCGGVMTGIVNKDDSPMYLFVGPGNIFDSSDDSEALRHDLLFVFGKYMKDDPEVSMVVFSTKNRMYFMNAQAFIYEHDRVVHGEDDLKDAWAYIERFTTKFELSEVADGCSSGADGITMMVFSPIVGSDGWTAFKFTHCATQIKVPLHNEPSDYHPRPAPEVPDVQTATTFRGHALGEMWQMFIYTEAGLCKMKINEESCLHAQAGTPAALYQFDKAGKSGESPSSVIFYFDRGYLEKVEAKMNGPTFADLSFLEKTYGPPSFKRSKPEKGFALSTWAFSDGGEVRAEERSNGTGGFTITINVMLTPSPHQKTIAGTTRPDQIALDSNSTIEGLYQSVPIGESLTFLRFYSDGIVIEVATTADATPADMLRWFRRPFDSWGKYEIQGSTIQFSITSPEGVVDYRGELQGTTLTLDSLSHINGRQFHDSFRLVTTGD